MTFLICLTGWICCSQTCFLYIDLLPTSWIHMLYDVIYILLKLNMTTLKFLWLWRHSLILNVELQRISSLSWLFRVFDATSVGSSSQVNTITYSHLSFYFVVFMQQLLFYRPALWPCLYCSLGRNTLLQSNMHHFVFSWYFFCAICKRKRYMILTLSMIMTLI